MKYLFIFLPIFCLAQGGDSTLYGVLTQSNTRLNYGSIDTCWEVKGGWMNLKPGCISIPSVTSNGEIINFKTQEFYVSDRKPRVIESFKYLGAYYELRENGWYKEILSDTIPSAMENKKAQDLEYINGKLRIKGDSVFRWAKEPKWTPCDEHVGKSESYQREKADTSEVKLLVWNGCSLEEISATRYLLYNEKQVADDTGGLFVHFRKTIKVDTIARYVSENKWIKPSHVIKEL